MSSERALTPGGTFEKNSAHIKSVKFNTMGDMEVGHLKLKWVGQMSQSDGELWLEWVGHL